MKKIGKKTILLFIGTMIVSGVNLSASISDSHIGGHKKFKSVNRDFENVEDMQKFYYELGKKEAKVEYYSKGYRDAIDDMRGYLEKYKDYIEEIEAGKFLVETGQIEYPRVFKVKEGDDYKIIIDKPRVTRKFDIDSLFLIPIRNSYYSAVSEKAKKEASNGFSLFVHSPQNKINSSPISLKQKVKGDIYGESVIIKGKNQNIKNILDTLPYKYKEMDNGYVVFFKDKNEKDFFLKKVFNKEDK